MKKDIKLTIILSVVSILVSAQEKTASDWVKDNTYYFEIKNSKIIGDGADILKKQIEESQFLILGEEHFSARVSAFTNAIVPTLATNNFNYFAAEIGPNSAEKITELIKKEGSLFKFNTKIYRLTGEVPIPFFDGKEDESFLKSFIENGFEIWGLDQEYLTAPTFLIDELYNLSKQKERLKPHYTAAKSFIIKEIQKSRENRKYKAFNSLLNSKEIKQFFNRLATSNPKTQKIISDLKKSWEVYKLREDKDLYASLYKRLDIMHSNFISYYSNALKTEKFPKVVIKIGGVHASKGRSHNNIYDIGNFIMELANYNNQKFTNILIFPSSYINKDGKISSNIEKEDELIFKTILEESKGKWVLIDLKNIEKASWKYKIESVSLKQYMYRFDYMILTPASKQTTLNFEK